jgi:hypothetical protein
MFGEWYQTTNKTEDTNKLTLLAFKIIAILHNTWLATFIKLLETVSKGRTAVAHSWNFPVHTHSIAELNIVFILSCLQSEPVTCRVKGRSVKH